jgi:hypothetical protein
MIRKTARRVGWQSAGKPARKFCRNVWALPFLPLYAFLRLLIRATRFAGHRVTRAKGLSDTDLMFEHDLAPLAGGAEEREAHLDIGFGPAAVVQRRAAGADRGDHVVEHFAAAGH